MVSWGAIQTLLLLFGPQVYSFVKRTYRATKPTGPPRPLPKITGFLLNFLFLSAILGIISTFQFSQPENVFLSTNSRLMHTQTSVIFNRLAQKRPLTPADEILKAKLDSKDARLLYATFGPEPLINCAWCTFDNPTSFFQYIWPSMAVPHLIHMFFLGIVTTSSFVENPEGGFYRTYATLGGIALAAIEWYLLATFPVFSNYKTQKVNDVTWMYWDAMFYRGIGIAVMDAILGYTIWLTATRRIDIGLDADPVKQVEYTMGKLNQVLGKLQGAKELRAVTMKDEKLREITSQFWDDQKEQQQRKYGSEEASAIRQRLETLPQVDVARKNARQKAATMLDPLKQIF